MSTPTMIWFEAIARRRCVRATYNGMAALLAPHVLYSRREQPYVGAVVIARRGVPAVERRLGIFAVAGLSACTLTDEAFEIDPSFVPDDPRYAAATLLAVELEPA